jgi:hypothetical protein
VNLPAKPDWFTALARDQWGDEPFNADIGDDYGRDGPNLGALIISGLALLLFVAIPAGIGLGVAYLMGWWP